MQTTTLALAIEPALSVSAIVSKPPRVRAGFVFAHGAGAGMNHSFMQAVAEGLFDRGIASLRYQFPFMERGSRRPDAPALAHAAVRAAVNEAAHQWPGLPLVAGGKSFGGRMSSQAQALQPLPLVRGLVFLGFPLHPAGRPADERAKHLFKIDVPMLFLQGTRDALADQALIGRLVEALGSRSSLHLLEHADHSFHVPARSGRTDGDVMREMLDVMARWVNKRVSQDSA